MKINNKKLKLNFPGWIFYIYLFLISAPIFVKISSQGIKWADYLMGIRQGFTMNVGILLLSVFIPLLGFKLFKTAKLKVGYFGKLIIMYCCVCFLVMLYGQLKDIRMIRLLLLGQVVTPFIAYFYILNFSEYIKPKVIKGILIFSLILQFCLFLYFNYRLSGSNIFTSSIYFEIKGTPHYIYGAYDYYPILFLTLVIFFHGVVDRKKDLFQKNVFTILIIALYAYGLMFHSRNSLIALIFLFAFYLFKRIKEKSFFRFFVWMTVLTVLLIILCPSVLSQNDSFTRLTTTINNYFNQKIQDTSTQGRAKALLYTFKIMREDPLCGIAFEWPYAAHNQYLSILGISGMISFSIFILLMWRIYMKLNQDFYFYRKNHQNASSAGAMQAIFILFIISSLFQNNFTVTYTSCIFWALIGVYEISNKALVENKTGLIGE